ncbi:MAG: hypothetical protein P4L99_29075 [Chthoniobacter sp.]|nr:hypothetical protein [Chthoniobacter sp.]
MKTDPLQSRLLSIGLGVLLCMAAISPARAEAPAKPPGPPKVRVIVKENMVASKPGGTSAATPAAAATPARAQGAGGAAQAANAANAANAAADAEKYTRTTRKSFTIELVNLTTANMDVNVKTTFLGKDEVGKRDVVTEKTVENQLTLEPGKGGQFTTEEVGFTHTTAHRAEQKAGGAGGGAGGGGGGKAKIAPMIPASGHAYYGYKVEVFQGPDLVGTAVSDTH